ncbi:peptidoglycan-binding protein [Streptomyces sp. CAU 1734]|uniref:peptidoglycan-binding protein n=1 Tax=Streptomyces sp. CAU 1734 TaxID=3140360 RepID=UPI003260F2C7
MATPMTADRFLAVLRDAGLDVHQVGDWRTHNRNSKGPWGPVHGVMIHHTVTRGTANTVALCRDGHATLPGPLCHGVIAKDGSVHLVGYGRTNHAGAGDDDVLRAVIAGKALPADNEANTDGNRHFYGFECVNLGDGQDPWPEAQLDAIAEAAAAICRHHGWTARAVIGHLEWQPGKIDPRGFSMDSLRARVTDLLGRTPGPQPRPPLPVRPVYQPYPGRGFFTAGTSSPVITAMGRRLVAERCGMYTVGPGPRWGEADRRSYAKWQRSLGYRGAAADGIPGPDSWARLKVPKP